MNAVVVERSAPGGLAVRAVEEPAPLPSQAVVRVHATSLNRGEIRRSKAAVDGARIGWDVAGIVEQEAADGSGPARGARVVGLTNVGWAERVAIATDALAVIPDAVSFEVASTLPVAGLTALMTLDIGGPLPGRRVLVTGASGGVGHFALQIARGAGAHTVGLVHREERRAAVAELADAIVVGSEATGAREHGPFDIILESVGGEVFSTALRLIAEDGVLVTFGASAGKESTIDVSAFYSNGGSSIYGFILFHELRRAPASLGLARLLDLIVKGRLTPRIDARYSFDRIAEATQFFWDRNIAGKVVVTLDR